MLRLASKFPERSWDSAQSCSSSGGARPDQSGERHASSTASEEVQFCAADSAVSGLPSPVASQHCALKVELAHVTRQAPSGDNP